MMFWLQIRIIHHEKSLYNKFRENRTNNFQNGLVPIGPPVLGKLKKNIEMSSESLKRQIILSKNFLPGGLTPKEHFLYFSAFF